MFSSLFINIFFKFKKSYCFLNLKIFFSKGKWYKTKKNQKYQKSEDYFIYEKKIICYGFISKIRCMFKKYVLLKII